MFFAVDLISCVQYNPSLSLIFGDALRINRHEINGGVKRPRSNSLISILPVDYAKKFLRIIPTALFHLKNALSQMFASPQPKLVFDYLPRNITEEIISKLDIRDIVAIAPGCGILHQGAWSENVWRKIGLELACPFPPRIAGVAIRTYVVSFIEAVVGQAIKLLARKSNPLVGQILERCGDALPSVSDCILLQRSLLTAEFQELFDESPPIELCELLMAPLSLEGKDALGEWRVFRDSLKVWEKMTGSLFLEEDVPRIEYHDTLLQIREKAEDFEAWICRHGAKVEELILNNCRLIKLPDLSSLQNLRVMLMHGNPLQEFPEEIAKFPRLEKVWYFETYIERDNLPNTISADIISGQISPPPLSFFQTCHRGSIRMEGETRKMTVYAFETGEIE